MLTDYIAAALRRARYSILEDGEGFYAEIPGFKGLWADSPTLEGCREQLRSVFESWLMIKLRHADTDLPVIERINLNFNPRRKSRVA